MMAIYTPIVFLSKIWIIIQTTILPSTCKSLNVNIVICHSKNKALSFLNPSKPYIFRMLLVVIFCLLVCIHAQKDNGTQGALSLPNPRDCANRIKHAEFNGHNYFFSWEYDLTKDLKVDWVTGRNICRRHCMDLVSLETR